MLSQIYYDQLSRIRFVRRHRFRRLEAARDDAVDDDVFVFVVGAPVLFAQGFDDLVVLGFGDLARFLVNQFGDVFQRIFAALGFDESRFARVSCHCLILRSVYPAVVAMQNITERMTL